MSSRPLIELADEVGLLRQWTDAHGEAAQLDEDAMRAVLRALDLAVDSEAQIRASLGEVRQRREAESGHLIITDADLPIDLSERLPPGSHCRLQREDGSEVDLHTNARGHLPGQPGGYHRLISDEGEWLLACAPGACPSVMQLTGRNHIWGIAAQVYSLRRPGDGGLGDTGALEELAISAGGLGADVLAISPLHAMFTQLPQQYSPYSPSSRNHFNVLHATPSQVLDAAWVEQTLRDCNLEKQSTELEALALIDWPAAAALRMKILRRLFQRFSSAPVAAQEDFQHFRLQGGEQLQLHCCHEALQQHLLEQGEGADWRRWPAHWRQPRSPEVRQFARQHAEELEFHAFGQWLAERGLARTQHSAREAGMGIGLIADMAIGADPAGSFGWACQEQLLAGVSIGAPPDLLNARGQNWGVAAFSPQGLRDHDYSAFIRMLRANLRHSGGLRIDHIMGLQRLWLVPDGADASQGAYLRYPLEDLLRLLTLEAWRHRALIIGEDLGTVPHDLQETLAQRQILGMRVLQFEQQDDELPAPGQWSDRALATTSTHDLPTTCGWLNGRDIQWRQEVDQCDQRQADEQRQERRHQIRVLDSALHAENLPTGTDDELRLDACIRFLGRTPAPLVIVPLEDVMAEMEQPNLPGAPDSHPNWRRRWPLPASRMLEQPGARQRLKNLDEERRNLARKQMK